MKLPSLPDKNTQENILEFDSWITPSLGSIKDTKRFKKELSDIVEILETIGEICDNFKVFDNFDAHAISSYFISKFSSHLLYNHLINFSKLLFLVTGKSDNNIKCQLPIYLHSLESFPGIPDEKGEGIEFKPIPRVIKSDSYMGIISKLNSNKKIQEDLLAIYVAFILDDNASKSQLWALGYSYFNLKPLNKEVDLLTSLVQFQVRGSVSASGGHIPEKMLRDQMSEWGLQAGVDFNLNDIIVSELLAFLGVSNNNKDISQKTRAYDFVIPFKTIGWQPKVFIQCQFYAGDSGSVSHKNVDQTRKSRNEILKGIEKPLFVEYVDGAGYFSSLNGDLKKLLSYSDTHSFLQIRTAWVKLRFVLQEIGFLTPLEVEHAILISNGNEDKCKAILLSDGYSLSEVNRCLEFCFDQKYIQRESSRLVIVENRVELTRKYFILDSIAKNGSIISNMPTRGHVIIPGYSSYYGLSLSNLGKLLSASNETISQLWSRPDLLLGDLGWLAEHGYIKNY